MDEQEQGWRKGPWTPEEDKLLSEYVKVHGEGKWSSVATGSGLNRIGKSCRLRWVNYLRPGLKRGHLTPQEEAIIIELHALWGNKWSTIARYLPGRTDHEIKNYWRTHFKKMKPKRKAQIDSKPNNKIVPPTSENKEEKEIMRACGRDDQTLVFTDPSMADQSYFASLAEESSLWGGLWEAPESEVVAESDHMNYWENVQAKSICFGGDSNIFYNGEFIFEERN